MILLSGSAGILPAFVSSSISNLNQKSAVWLRSQEMNK